jgi:N utilization substance protein A
MFFDSTGVEAGDCIISEEGIAFLVPRGYMGKAIGKNGSNIQRLRSMVNKNVYIFEDIDVEEEFIKRSLNVVSPSIQEAEKNNKKVIYVKLNASDRYSMKRGVVVMFAKELFERIFGKELKIQSR